MLLSCLFIALLINYILLLQFWVTSHFCFFLVHELCLLFFFLLVSVCIHGNKIASYLLAWCHPPHQLIAMSAVSEIMQLAAAKLPPATSRVQSYRSSNTGQSKAANTHQQLISLSTTFSFCLTCCLVHSDSQNKTYQENWRSFASHATVTHVKTQLNDPHL